MMTMSEKQKFIKKLELEKEEYNKRIKEYNRRMLEVRESVKLTETSKDLMLRDFAGIIQYDLGKVKKIEKLIEDITLL